MRIRSIKPEYWRSVDITDLDIADRLLFVGLWSYVDDNGVGIDDDATIIGDLFARDMFRDSRETVARVTRGLSNLSDAGLIERYTVDGRGFLFVTNWSKHQRIDKPGKPRYPRSDAENAVFATVSRESPEILAPGTGEQGNRGTGEQGNRSSAHPADSPRANEINQMFDTFWSEWPVKKDKENARKSFIKAIKAGAEMRRIMAGVEAYKRELGPIVAGKTVDGRTPKYAQGWLTGKRWEDEAELVTAGAMATAGVELDCMTGNHKWLPNGTCMHCPARPGDNPF